MSKKWMFLLAVTAAILLSTSAFAQMKPSDEPQEKPMRNRAHMRQRIEMIKMWKLTEVLNLDEKTAAKLFPMVHDYDQQQWKLREKRHEIIKGMKAELDKEKPDSAALTKMIDAIKQNQLDIVETRNKALEDFSNVLSKEQVARMIIAISQFEREVGKRVWETRGRRTGHGMGMRGESAEWQQCPCPMHQENCPLGKKMMRKGATKPPAKAEKMP
jgi:Spy/CpxP family protein refolding chaperone